MYCWVGKSASFVVFMFCIWGVEAFTVLYMMVGVCRVQGIVNSGCISRLFPIVFFFSGLVFLQGSTSELSNLKLFINLAIFFL